MLYPERHQLCVIPSGGIRTLGHDLLVEFVTNSEPLVTLRAWQASLLGETEASIEGDPEHNLGVCVILLSAANFPDRHVRIWQVLAGIRRICQWSYPYKLS